MSWLRPLLEVVILGVIPLAAIGSGKIHCKFRFGLLAAIGVLMVIDVKLFEIPMSDLGLRLDNLGRVWPWYFGLAVVGCLAIILYGRIRRIDPLRNWRQDPHFWFWFVPISIGQQFVFFAFLQSRLQEFLPVGIAVSVSAIMFASAHLMYRPRCRAFLLTALGGLAFAVLYAAAPNMLAGAVAHMILNVVIVQRNLFTFSDTSSHETISN